MRFNPLQRGRWVKYLRIILYSVIINFINSKIMKKSKFFIGIFTVLLFMAVVSDGISSVPAILQYFEIRIYHIADKSQEGRVDAYLKDVYLPALHRANIQIVGVFKPVETDTAFGKLIYMFIPFNTIDQFMQLPGVLERDKVYAEAGKSFVNADFTDPPYKRYESILLKAFSNMPQFIAPKFTTSPSERIYELRSYESATEAKAVKKIEMFNQGGEIDLFKSLNFNAVFYGEVLVGSHKPNLMYMTTFENMESHDAHWKSFTTHPAWLKLKEMPEFMNTVSRNSTFLLHPTSYSDF